MAKKPVTRLRHLAVAVPNFEEAVNFYQDAWGLKKVEQEPGLAFFAAEGSPEQYVFRIRKSDERRTDLIAFGVDDAASVDDLANELASQGVRFASEPGPLQTPGGGYGFRFFDPDGRVLEVSSDVAEREAREIEDREAIPVKVSHVVLGSPNVAEMAAFYDQALGFRLSDWIGDGMCFMRCTPDHHNIGIFQSRSDVGQLNHIAFDMKGANEMMAASGRVLKIGTMSRWGPGRHLVGDNTFWYFYDPNGNVSEFTSDMEKMPLEGARAPRVVQPSDNGELWGTAKWNNDPVPEHYLTPETGQGVAPPI